MIDYSLQQELRAKYNPDGSAVRNHQMKILEVLKEFDAICRKHGIKYWLGAGTCLGAVRHGGFIPWDDDADVEMFMDDYKKFVKVFQAEYADGAYTLQTRESDLFYTMAFAKFRSKDGIVREKGHGADRNYKYNGPFVDIFILDKTTKRMSGLFKQGSCHLHLFTKIDNPGPVTRGLLRFFKGIYLFNSSICTPLCRHLPWAKTRFSLGCVQYKLEFDPNDLKETIDMEFEGHTFKVPAGWDHYLTMVYGDYMSFPPEEERIGDMHLLYDTKE